MKFSIIMPVYNTEKYVETAIVSVLHQTYQDYELICVNDGSTDQSAAILNRFAENHKVLVITNVSNNGPLSARITGAAHCSGDYILFLDSDDWLEPNALHILCAALKQADYDYIEFPYYEVQNNRKKRNIFSKEDDEKNMRDILLSRANHTIWNKCFNTVFLKPICEQMPDFYAVFAEDYYQMAILEYFTKKRNTINTPLYNYRMTTGISNTPCFDNVERIKNIDCSIDNVIRNLSLFFEKENRVEYMQYVRYYLNTIYLDILLHTNLSSVIEVIKKRFGDEGFTLLLVQQIKMLNANINKVNEEYRPLHIFAKILKRPFEIVKQLLY